MPGTIFESHHTRAAANVNAKMTTAKNTSEEETLRSPSRRLAPDAEREGIGGRSRPDAVERCQGLLVLSPLLPEDAHQLAAARVVVPVEEVQPVQAARYQFGAEGVRAAGEALQRPLRVDVRRPFQRAVSRPSPVPK